MKNSNFFLIVLIIGILTTSSNIYETVTNHNKIFYYLDERTNVLEEYNTYTDKKNIDHNWLFSEDANYIKSLSMRLHTAYGLLALQFEELRNSSFFDIFWGVVLMYVGYKGWKSSKE